MDSPAVVLVQAIGLGAVVVVPLFFPWMPFTRVGLKVALWLLGIAERLSIEDRARAVDAGTLATVGWLLRGGWWKLLAASLIPQVRSTAVIVYASESRKVVDSFVARAPRWLRVEHYNPHDVMADARVSEQMAERLNRGDYFVVINSDPLYFSSPTYLEMVSVMRSSAPVIVIDAGADRGLLGRYSRQAKERAPCHFVTDVKGACRRIRLLDLKGILRSFLPRGMTPRQRIHDVATLTVCEEIGLAMWLRAVGPAASVDRVRRTDQSLMDGQRRWRMGMSASDVLHWIVEALPYGRRLDWVLMRGRVEGTSDDDLLKQVMTSWSGLRPLIWYLRPRHALRACRREWTKKRLRRGAMRVGAVSFTCLHFRPTRKCQ
jgi:hypothetical protein